MAELSAVELPSDGYSHTGRLQMRCGRACAEIEGVFTDDLKNVHRRQVYLQIAPLQHKLPKSIDAAEQQRLGDILKGQMEYEMSAEGRAADAAVVQERIDADVAHKVEVLDGRAQKPLGVRKGV